MDTSGLDELNKQGSYLTTLEKEENKSQWINILRNKPTEAINAYHKALCSNGKNKGYCDLLDLFRIMGALEQVKDGKMSVDNENKTSKEHSEEMESIKKNIREINLKIDKLAPDAVNIQEETHKQKISDIEKKNNEDLVNINIAVDNLKNKIDNASSENKEFSKDSSTNKSQTKITESTDKSNEVESLKKEINELNDKHKENIKQLENDYKEKLNAEKSTEENDKEEISKLRKDIDNLNIQHEKQILELQNKNLNLEKSKQNLSNEEIEKLRNNIKELTINNEKKIKELQDKYVSDLEKEKLKIKEEVEKWKQEREYEEDDEDENLIGGNTNKNLKPGNAPKEKTKEERQKQEKALNVDVGSRTRAIDANENIKKAEDVEIEFTTCGDGKKMNDEFGKELFTLYEKAKEVLNSDMLPIIGCLHFYKLNLLATEKNKTTSTLFTITENHEQILNKLEDALFIQLTEEEYKEINDKITLISKTSPKLKYAFDTICERDNKYKKEDSYQSIMVYALLWVFHFNINVSIKDSVSTYQQIISNNTLFTDKAGGAQFITAKTCKVIAAIGIKIRDSITVLEEIKNTFIGESQNAEYTDIRQKYINIVQNNKSVLALLKRRDDWNNKTYTTPGKKHQRFEMKMPNKNNTIFEPLTLKYNDTPLVLAEDDTNSLDKMMSHHYTFYGFDAVFESNLGNADIASRLSNDFIKDTRPLCFIGYGQSGSGKTSTLVYLDVPGMEEDGILMELLKNIAPQTVTVSMIEIYQATSAKESDESCLGIGTSSHTKKGEIIPCYPLNDKGVPEKPRVKIPYVPMEKNEPAMRYVTIGEVLDKQFDDKTEGEIREKQEDIDKNLQSTFTMGNYSSCAGEDAGKQGWLYTHGNGTKECLDKNFGLKHYILMGFECREVAPTSNNKQSSRSHVVVSMELNHPSWEKPRSIFVCDLAGVENVFDCTPGSTDMIRMKAKTKANKNYSNNLGKGNIEEWDSLNKKRVGNIVKFIHKDIHIGTSTPRDPNCWPDGNANEAGELSEITDNFSKELMKIYWYHSIQEKDIIPRKSNNTSQKGGSKLTPDDVFKYFKEKLEKLPLKKDKNDKIIGLESVKSNIKSFWKSASTGNNFDWFLRGKKNVGSAIPVSQSMVDNIDWDTWANHDQYDRLGINTVELVKTVFNSLEAPDCVSSYTSGFEKACKTRVREGYIINNTLAQLTKDVKKIAKYAIKQRLEYESMPLDGNKGEKRSAGDYPCLYADTYDGYNYYSKTTNPLMDWYDIDDPLKEDFGMILSAMCLLKDQDQSKWSIPEKLNFLKQFRFNYCTVLNETYVMNFGGEEAKTPAGNLIYVNNPPLPPFINVGILENSYKEFIFYENDPRNDDKKYKAFLNVYNNFLNLVVKMFKHPNYEETAVKIMQGLADIASQEPKLIFFKNEQDIKDNFNDKKIIEYLKSKTKEIINLIKKNNNATYIGTIQTTEEVNRVSEKVLISKAVNQESQLSSIDEDNINVKLLKKLFIACYLRKSGDKSTILNRRDGKKGKMRRTFIDKKKEMSAILYECLYEINKLYEDNEMLKPCKSMKDRDIDAILNSIEMVFPIMTRYIEPSKLQAVWEMVSSLERGESVIKGKKFAMYSDNDKKNYPYERDLTNPGGSGLAQWDTKSYTKDNFKNNFIVEDIKNADSPLLEFNNVLANSLKNEPSIPYLRDSVWNEEQKEKKWGYAYKLKSGEGKYPRLKTFFNAVGFKRKDKGKATIMPYLTTMDFFKGTYGAYIGETFKPPNKWNPKNDSFSEFKAVKSAQVKKFISNNDQLSKKGIKVSYPPDSFSEDDEDDDDEMMGGGETNPSNNVSSGTIITKINTISDSIGNLSGVNQYNMPNETSSEDLVKINTAVEQLRKSIESISPEGLNLNKLEEALNQLKNINL